MLIITDLGGQFFCLSMRRLLKSFEANCRGVENPFAFSKKLV
ncbi:hypothetical protein SAMN04487931_108144 [Desulfobacula phenolica]|uniref:Uncharacterized protein n=1 Tax=Desulfobacula phenolica TaxID=90732 RepID=A0A1H2IG01_9BACT|nr:hypothetical protein SAMN04487931_108144 [Desulfobacula phenolica]